MKPVLARLKWNDAHSPGSTEQVSLQDLDMVHQPLAIETVGWMLKNDLVGVTIAGECCGDGDYRNVTFVPRAMVTAVVAIAARKQRLAEPVKEIA